jgi:putative spermidine/putrescine transport system ATP-binding protein
MVYVTHDQTEAMTMSDRIAVFRSGALEQVGSPLDVYNRPVNRFVGEFIGESNFFPARVDRAHPDCVDLIGIGRARVADKLPAAGTDLLLMIRPERLRLQAASPAENEFEMLLDDVINYGDSILLIGTTRGQPLRARIAGKATDDLRRGLNITLAWSPGDAHILPV